MTLKTTERYMQYNSRIMKALKAMNECRNFIQSKQLNKYTKLHPERISEALLYLEEAKITLTKSYSAYFGGDIKIIVR